MTDPILSRFYDSCEISDSNETPEIVRDRFVILAYFLHIILPESPEKNLAMTKLEEAAMLANKASMRESD